MPAVAIFRKSHGVSRWGGANLIWVLTTFVGRALREDSDVMGFWGHAVVTHG